MFGWIKHVKNLSTKEEVVRMATLLGIDRWSVVGRCEDIWSWADEHTTDGNALGVTSAFLDELVYCPGFSKAMIEVGWLAENDGGVHIPKFDRHNGNSGKKRALTAERVRKHREQGNAPSVTDSVSVSVSASVSDSSVPLPEELNTDAFKSAWSEYEQYRRERKMAKLKPRSVASKYKELAEYGHDEAIAAIERTIANGWAGIFPAQQGPAKNAIGNMPPAGSNAAWQKQRRAAKRGRDFPEPDVPIPDPLVELERAEAAERQR